MHFRTKINSCKQKKKEKKKRKPELFNANQLAHNDAFVCLNRLNKLRQNSVKK